jgi:cation transport ATPase
VLFDKTGTLTEGTPELVDVEVEPSFARDAVLAAAVALECATNHPIARALRASHGEAEVPPASDLRVLPGLGVEGRVGGRQARLVRAEPRPGSSATAVELFLDGQRAARFLLAGRPRAGAREALDALRRRGLELLILTGDGAGPARALADELGLCFEAGLLPAAKLERVQARGGRGVLFVGDGINDAAALAAADVGAVLRGAADVARGEASVELLHADLRVLPELLERSRRAVRVARGNLAWAFGYNAVGVALAADGRLTPVFAASAMVVSSVLVALRAARLAEE